MANVFRVSPVFPGSLLVLDVVAGTVFSLQLNSWLLGCATAIGACLISYYGRQFVVNLRMEANGSLKYFDFKGTLRADIGWECVYALRSGGNGCVLDTAEGIIDVTYFYGLNELADLIRERNPTAQVNPLLGNPFPKK